MITPGQIYQDIRNPQRRIRIVGEPGNANSVYGYGKTMVKTILADGTEVRPRRIETTELHATATTRHGEPRRTGYVLVQDTEETR